MAVKTSILDESIENIVKKIDLKHIAVIMDGNRRWAKNRNFPSAAGHKEGVKALRRTVNELSDIGVKYLTVYAFSTENWERKEDEVNFLMFLLGETIKNEVENLNANNVKLRIIGNVKQLNNNLQDILNDAMKKTENNSGLNLQIAINYGARDEITNAVKNIAKDFKNGNISESDITQNLISNYLYTSEVPDPDLLIRTGGEQRISNYLLWQIAYTEIFVTDVLWPDFNKETIKDAIMDFVRRDRRFGKG